MGRMICLQIFSIAPGCQGLVLGKGGSYAPLQADWSLSIREAISTNTGAGRQCADVIEADISADRPEHIQKQN